MNKKILWVSALSVMMVGALAQNALAAPVIGSQASALVLLQPVSSNDLTTLVDRCGQVDSKADVCASAFNVIIAAKLTNVTPVTDKDVALFWKQCVKNGNNRQCADNLNVILAHHITSKEKFTVTVDDVVQAKNLYFANDFAGVAHLGTTFFGATMVQP